MTNNRVENLWIKMLDEKRQGESSKQIRKWWRETDARNAAEAEELKKVSTGKRTLVR